MEVSAMAAGRYEIWLNASRQYRWRFRARNGEVISSGESYVNRADCERAIRLMQGSATAPVVALAPIQPRRRGLFGGSVAYPANPFAEQAPNQYLVNALRMTRRS